MNIVHSDIRRVIVAALFFVLALTAACTPKTTMTTSTTPAKAVKLVFATQPLGGEAGSHLVVQPVVTALDASGKIVSGPRLIVTLSLTDITPEMHIGIFGATTLTSLNGIFSFKEISIDKVGKFTLTASCSGLPSVVSDPIEITPIGGAHLKFTTTLTRSVGGLALSSQPVVSVMDMYGNVSTSSVAQINIGLISVTPDPYGAKLSGTLASTAASGVAGFKDVSIDLVGTYVLTASSPGLVPCVSNSFEIIPGAPVKLFFNSQPITTTPGSPLTVMPPTIPVLIQDACGNTVTDSSAEVTIFLTPNTGTPGAVLSGQLKVNATTGAACFGDLSVDKLGKGYTLTATSPGLLTAVSDPFEITLTPPAIASDE
ncbi:MAG TPA: hypothetical protein VMB24_02755 [Dehalococcoidales bacterium]|nr:hypothetical protein [Dehalococcoidales bacterium]